VANENNWLRGRCRLRRQPGALRFAYVSWVTSFVRGPTFLIPIKNYNGKPIYNFAIIRCWYAPVFGALCMGMPAVGIMVANHMKAGFIAFVEQINHWFILLVWVGKIAQLHYYVWLMLIHDFYKCLHPVHAIVHYVVMKICNKAKPQLLAIAANGRLCLGWYTQQKTCRSSIFHKRSSVLQMHIVIGH
jgi:hypothetical protein